MRKTRKYTMNIWNFACNPRIFMEFDIIGLCYGFGEIRL